MGDPHPVEPIIDQLKGLVLQLNPSLTSEQLHDDASIVDDLGLDSIVVVMLINLIEDRFDFIFAEDDLNMNTFSTVRFLAGFIATHLLNGQD